MGGGRAGRRRSTSEWAYGGGGAVLALDRHPPAKVEGLEAIRVVALLLQRVHRVVRLVKAAAAGARRPFIEPHLEVGRGERKVLAVG